MSKYGVIRLSPIEQRYLATCPAYEGRPGIEELYEKKEFMIESSILGDDIEVPVQELIVPFPHISRLYKEGFFENRTVQDYFEGLDQESHNMRLYLFPKMRMKKLPEHLLEKIINHANICAVKPADIEDGSVWYFSDIKEHDFDTEIFGGQEYGRYALVHGKTESGLIVVRGITEKEFDEYADWFSHRKKLI